MVNLVQWDRIKNEIEQSNDIEQLSSLRDQAEAIRILAKQSKQSIETQNQIAEYRIRAERKIGIWAKENIKAGNFELSPKSIIQLSDVGITANQSSKWQNVADLPEEKFEEHIKSIKEEGEELTTAGVVRKAREFKRQNLAEGLSEVSLDTSKKYRVIYADPPWSYGNTMPEYFTEQEDHYRTMSLQEICEMPVRNLSIDNAVLFLWVTSPILEEAFEVIKAWGFIYKTSFVWDKIKHNMGHYNSVRHEFLLVCTKGSCLPDVKKLFDSVISVERTKHSEKPEDFRDIIDIIYPIGDRIELFSRKKVNNWDCHGNQI